MPIFEYKCGKCGKRSEFLEKSSRQPSRTCSYCGSKDLQKLLSTFVPQIKAGTSKSCHTCTDYKCPHAGN
ncbi:MAG: FmdB family zinc ribbon protein [Planctomycetota bacterium]